MKLLSLIALVLIARMAIAEEWPRVTADIAAYDAHIAALDAEFVKRPADPHERNWVRLKLAHMVNVDQYLRQFSTTPVAHAYTDAERLDFGQRFLATRWPAVDARNTADLKELLEIHGWFKISTFGEEADTNAWLLAQHADQDRDFQRRVLAMLGPLVEQQETRPQHFAYLYDRLAVAPGDSESRRPQRFGTQGHCVATGRWEPFEVEDPVHLDARRAAVGLPSEAEYQAQFVSLCLEPDEGMRQRPKNAVSPK